MLDLDPAFRPVRRRDGYLPLEDLGPIGDGATVALVGLDGSIPWLCVPRFDAEPLFCGLLDQVGGGQFSVVPDCLIGARQAYQSDTAVLATDLRSATGTVRITDALAARSGADLTDDGGLLRQVLAGDAALSIRGDESLGQGSRPARGVPGRLARTWHSAMTEIRSQLRSQWLRLVSHQGDALRLGMNWTEGIWQSGYPIHRLRGRQLGLLSFGAIAQAIARRGSAFGMRVAAHDPYLAAADIEARGAASVSFEVLLEDSDYLVVQAPLTKETRHLIGEAELRRMKPAAILVNTARGPIVSDEALYRALTEGWIAGAGLDDVITPHAAYYSEESITTVRDFAAREVVRVLTGAQPLSPVNASQLAELAEPTTPGG
jgi:hypothetical protein